MSDEQLIINEACNLFGRRREAEREAFYDGALFMQAHCQKELDAVKINVQLSRDALALANQNAMPFLVRAEKAEARLKVAIQLLETEPFSNVFTPEWMQRKKDFLAQ